MSDQWSWDRLCSKCERVHARYGGGTSDIPSDPADPLDAFDDWKVAENVMCFVVYILWLKQRPDSFERYLQVRELRFDLWRLSVYRLWRF